MSDLKLCFQIGAIMHQSIMTQYAKKFEYKILSKFIFWIEMIIIILNNIIVLIQASSIRIMKTWINNWCHSRNILENVTTLKRGCHLFLHYTNKVNPNTRLEQNILCLSSQSKTQTRRVDNY